MFADPCCIPIHQRHMRPFQLLALLVLLVMLLPTPVSAAAPSGNGSETPVTGGSPLTQAELLIPPISNKVFCPTDSSKRAPINWRWTRQSSKIVQVEVQNLRQDCTVKIGLASYKMFDSSLATQQLFDTKSHALAPGATTRLTIRLPECRTQVDLFVGQVIRFLGKERYGHRLYTARLIGKGFCLNDIPTATNTVEPTETATATHTPTATETATNTATPTDTPTATETATPTDTPTATETATNTATPSNTATETATPSNTATATETATNTPTATNTATPSNTATNTPTNTATPSNTATATETATNTPTFTPTPSNTPTETATNTPTFTPTPSNTPTETATNTPTLIPTPPPDTVRPQVDQVLINGGLQSTTAQSVNVKVIASDPEPGTGVRAIFIGEYIYNESTDAWERIGDLKEFSYTATPSQYPWTLSPGPGVKYLLVVAVDNAGNLSLERQALINYVPPSETVKPKSRMVSRYYANKGDQIFVYVQRFTGDPDLFVFAPPGTPESWGSANPQGDEQVTIIAPVSGIYQVEVFGFDPNIESTYRLLVQITSPAPSESIVPMSVEPEENIVKLTSDTNPVAPNPPLSSAPSMPHRYLPFIFR